MNYKEACKILEASPDDSLEKIKKCYLLKVKFYHPDNHQNDAQQTDYAKRMTQKVNEAWEYIRNNYASRFQEEQQESKDDSNFNKNDHDRTNPMSNETNKEDEYQYTYTIPVYEPIFTSTALIVFSVIFIFIFSLVSPFLSSGRDNTSGNTSFKDNLSGNMSDGGILNIGENVTENKPQYSQKDQLLLAQYNFKEVNNGYAVSAKDKNISGEISLPNVFNGKPIIEIDNNGFENCTFLSEIIISNNIVNIGEEAFSGCSSLKKITIPNSVANIGKYSFAQCSKLSDVTLSDSLDVLPRGIFHGCTSLSSISIPKSVNTIEYAAFEGCSALQIIEISDNIKSIEGYAFKDCTSLNYVHIPSTVEALDSLAFKDCIGLKEIEIKTDKMLPVNSTWPVFDGCKNVEKVTIHAIWLKNIGNLTPKSLTVCEASEFFSVVNMNSLDSVVLDIEIKVIKTRMFYYCANLKEIHLPNTVETIENQAFSSCPKLTDVYYSGSMEEWKRIELDEEWYSSNNIVTVHCSDGDIEYTK